MEGIQLRYSPTTDLEVRISLEDVALGMEVRFNVTICGYSPQTGICVETNTANIPRRGPVTVRSRTSIVVILLYNNVYE